MGSYENRCGGRGFRVFAARIPAASDLVGIYEDVGAMLITLSTSIVHSFRLSTSVSRGSAISAIRTSPGCYPFERKDRSEEHTSELQSLRHLVCRLLLEKKN